MNILIVANHYAVCSGRYAAAAFERLGHTVRHAGPAMGRHIWGLTLPAEYVWEPDTSMTVNYDLTVVMDSDPLILNVVQEPEPVVVWGVDNHVRDYRREWFDHYFLAHRKVSVTEWNELKSILKPEIVEHHDMFHLPCAYDPTLHTPSLIPFEARGYDVCMIGVMYPQRWALVKALREAGFSVLAGCGLVYENYVNAYHNSRIALNISSNGDVAQRVFETAAMGNVVMTDKCADYDLLKPEGFWLLDNTEPDTVIQACKDILAEPEQAQHMAEVSQVWVQGNTWDERANQIIEWYEEVERIS